MPRNITQFYAPTDTSVDAADLIHLGRTSLPLADQDIKLTGAEFYESMNFQQVIYGAPTAPTVYVSGLRETIRGFQSEYAPGSSVVDRANGTLTVGASGTYRTEVLLIMSCPNQNGFNIASYIAASGGGDLVMSAQSVASRAGAGDLISLSGSTLVTLTAGWTMTMEVESAVNLTGVSYLNGSFSISPIALA